MRQLATVVILAIVLVACATSPLGRRQLQLFPDEQIDEMGGAAYRDIRQQMKPTESEAITRYVNCVADAITDVVEKGPEDWEVTVFKKDDANAFALPGGKIGVNTGLLDVAENQDQLAAVIGHEVAHVLAEHANERVSTAFATETALDLVGAMAGDGAQKQQLMGLLGIGAQVGVILPFSRTQEREADLLGIDLMAEAGFDPRASVDLWKNMMEAGNGAPPEFLSTHPAGKTRIDELQGRMRRATQIYRRAQEAGRTPDCPRP